MQHNVTYVFICNKYILDSYKNNVHWQPKERNHLHIFSALWFSESELTHPLVV